MGRWITSIVEHTHDAPTVIDLRGIPRKDWPKPTDGWRCKCGAILKIRSWDDSEHKRFNTQQIYVAWEEVKRTDGWSPKV